MGKVDNPSRKAAQEQAAKTLKAAERERARLERLAQARENLVKAENERVKRFIGYRGR